jgi:phosphate transport system protein
MSAHFEQEFEKLRKVNRFLGEQVLQCLRDTVQCLDTRDQQLSDSVVGRGARINRQGAEVERQCVRLLALQQPMAQDLRYVVSVLKLKTDLVRIAQQAGNIAEEVPGLKDANDSREIAGAVREQLDLAVALVEDALRAIVELDAELAQAAIRRDDEVDRLYNQVQEAVEAYIQKNPADLDTVLRYLKISRELERMADHAVNICEDVVFVASGKLPGGVSLTD